MDGKVLGLNMSGKTKVAFHFPCFDGFTAAWAANKALGDTAEYIPSAYGDNLPLLEAGDTLYCLDYTFHPSNRKKIPEGVDVRIIDHHKTAQEVWGDYPNAIFDMNHSGAWLAWDYFHNTPENGEWSVPKLVQYVEDRDLWRWRLPNSREITDWLGLFPFTFNAWDEAHEVLTQNFDQAVSHGQIAAQAHKRAVEDILVQNVRCCDSIGGYSVPVANCPKRFGSDVAAALLSLFPDAKFSAYYSDSHNGLREYGIRGRGDFDVSEVARIYGGGGHFNAAGFRVGRQQSLDPMHFKDALILE